MEPEVTEARFGKGDLDFPSEPENWRLPVPIPSEHGEGLLLGNEDELTAGT
jgi:hypothetical protein